AARPPREPGRRDRAEEQRGRRVERAQRRGERRRARRTSLPRQAAEAPWHFLYFLPLPHGQSSLRPTRGTEPGDAARPIGAETVPSDGAPPEAWSIALRLAPPPRS